MLADERAKLKEGVYPARGDVPEPAAGGSAALGNQDLNRDRKRSCPRPRGASPTSAPQCAA